MTPEGKVKKELKDWLKTIIVPYYAHWPVQTGMGAPDLDCNLVVAGYDWTIECKAPVMGAQLTARQHLTMLAKLRAGGIVLVIDGSPFDYDVLNKVLDLLVDRRWPEARAAVQNHRHHRPFLYRDNEFHNGR